MEFSLFALLGLLVAVATATPLKATQSVDEIASRTDVDYRLPNHTLPLHYNISLLPFIVEGNFTFNGEVTIDINVLQATSSIVLHANNLTIDDDSVIFRSAAGSIVAVPSKIYNATLQFYTLSFASALPAGNYSIFMKFVGYLDDSMTGFYRSYYFNSSGDKVWLATTQLQPVSARKAFPCFDEPALKATFDIHIAHFLNQTALSNMPNKTTSAVDSSIGDRVWTTFDTTPLMSTYLLAFIVHDFSYLSNSDQSFRVWSRPNAIDTANYALVVGEQELDSLSNFTGYSYNNSVPKMDQIAIPDFSAGAMENWGLVTYRERLLLVKDGVSAARDVQNIATVMSHEFGHQWYGNLISPTWWNYVWLNEGFATYFEYFTTSTVETTWRLMDQFTVDNYHSAFAVDGLDTARPLNHDVGSPSEIYSKFDIITYQKAGSLIRMMSHFLTESVFQEGLKIYVQNKAYGTATPDDLWEALETASNSSSSTGLLTHLKIKTIMDTWTEQKGYPLVTVTRNYTTRTNEISQERFLLKGRGSSSDTTEYRWWVPINFVSQANLNFDSTVSNDWIRAQDESIMISGFQPENFIIFNKQQTGYYRVNYDVTNWNMIIEYLLSDDFENIHVLNRAQLVDDALNLARAGYLDYSVALNLTSYLAHEQDHIPWQAAFNGFAFLNRMLVGTDGYNSFQQHILNLTSNITETLTYEEKDEDEHVHKFLRANALTWACNFGDSECLSFARDKLSTWITVDDESIISPNLRGVVYCAGIRQADNATWELVWNKYLSTDLSSDKIRILVGLGCSEDEAILNRFMKLATTAGSGIRAHDSTTAFVSVYTSSSKNVDVALNYIINNLDDMIAYYGGVSTVGSLLSGIASRITTDEQLAKLRNFAEAQSATLGAVAASAISNAEDNIAWIETYEPSINEWLPEIVSQESAATSSIFGSSLLTITLVYLAQHFY